MFNEYDAQAEDFLKDTNSKMTIRFLDRKTNPSWHDSYERNHYSVTLTTERGKMKIQFCDSYDNTINHKRPRPYDVLACLSKYDPGSFEDFCDEFGYEYGRIKEAIDTYKAVKKEYKQLSKIYTEEQMEKLREIQ